MMEIFFFFMLSTAQFLLILLLKSQVFTRFFEFSIESSKVLMVMAMQTALDSFDKKVANTSIGTYYMEACTS